jgi:hypothetical protein
MLMMPKYRAGILLGFALLLQACLFSSDKGDARFNGAYQFTGTHVVRTLYTPHSVFADTLEWSVAQTDSFADFPFKDGFTVRDDALEQPYYTAHIVKTDTSLFVPDSIPTSVFKARGNSLLFGACVLLTWYRDYQPGPPQPPIFSAHSEQQPNKCPDHRVFLEKYPRYDSLFVYEVEMDFRRSP